MYQRIRSMKNDLIESIEKVHTTEQGAKRIRRNAGIVDDPVTWCRQMILDKKAVFERKGKNWYVFVDKYIITVNASSFTIITVHKAENGVKIPNS